MTAFDVRIDVTHRAGILDPAGATVERALPALGWGNVSDVSIAKTIRLRLDAPDEAHAREQVLEMCEQILANPVIEDYDIVVSAAASERAPA